MLLKIYSHIGQELIDLIFFVIISLNIIINLIFNIRQINYFLAIALIILGGVNLFLYNDIYYSNIISMALLIAIINIMIHAFKLREKFLIFFKKLDKELIYIVVLYLILSIFKNNSYLINPMSNFMQYLDYSIVSSDFIKAIIFQHSSPPLLTIVYGLLAKFWLLNSYVLYILSIFLLCVNYLVLRSIAEYLNWNKCNLYIVFLFPSVFFYLFWSYQPIWGFTFINIFVYAYLTNNYRYQIVAITLLSLTHVIFHPLIVLTYTLYALFSKKINSKYIIIGIIPIIFLIKNVYLFDTYSLSSWTGCNLSQMIPGNDSFNQEKIKKYIDENQLIILEKSDDVLTSLHKNNNEYNYNHIHMINYCKMEGKLAVKYILSKPLEFLRTIRTSISERALLNSISYEGFHEYFINSDLNSITISFIKITNGLLMLLFNLLIPLFIFTKSNSKFKFIIAIALAHALITHITNGFEQQRMTFQFLIVYHLCLIYFIKYVYNRFFIAIIHKR